MKFKSNRFADSVVFYAISIVTFAALAVFGVNPFAAMFIALSTDIVRSAAFSTERFKDSCDLISEVRHYSTFKTKAVLIFTSFIGVFVFTSVLSLLAQAAHMVFGGSMYSAYFMILVLYIVIAEGCTAWYKKNHSELFC